MKVYLSFSRTLPGNAFFHRVQTAIAQIGHEALYSESLWQPDESARLLASSDCVMAHIIDLRPSVVFDVGYAVGAGKPVMLVVKPGAELPPDFDRLPMISWEGIRADQALREIADWLAEVQRERLDYRPQPAGVSLLKLYRTSPAAFEQVDPAEFERAVLGLFETLGYHPAPVDGTRDLGYDLVLASYDGTAKTLVHIKKCSSSTKVSADTLQQLLGQMYAYRADCGIVVSSSGFTASATEFARRCGARIELWDMNEILVRVDEADRLVAPSA